MTAWVECRPGELVVAHISDLHFGTGQQKARWDELARHLKDRVQPKLVLVTGDIVDTPDENLYMEAHKALEDLRLEYFVCPGNHDWHWHGNKLRFLRKRRAREKAALFGDSFGFRKLSCERPETRELSPQWTLGLVALDSSRDADVFARGYVDTKALDAVEKALSESAERQSWDLVVALIHHHLQPVRALEGRFQTPRDVVKLKEVTAMANAGSVLERLSKCHVDLVLHGHEHESHWGMYASLEGDRGAVRVVGAGSGTGVVTGRDCVQERMSYNEIVLAPDRSARLRVVRWAGGEWTVPTELGLWDAVSARRLQLMRRSSEHGKDLDGQVIKHSEFTRERDIRVKWVFSNWVFTQKTYSHRVENSTGEPADATVEIHPEAAAEVETLTPQFKQEQDPKAWTLPIEVPEKLLNRRVRFEMSFRWIEGGLLTQEEMAAVLAKAPGYPRSEGLEFAAVWSPVPVASAHLVLTVPADYAQAEPRVLVFDEQYRPQPEAEELRSRVRGLGPGRYSLLVPYPRPRVYYALAWKPISPVPENTSPEARQLIQIARVSGNELAEAFLADAKKHLPGRLRVSLFTKAGYVAKRVGHACDEPNPGPAPEDLALDGANAALIRQAFWGARVTVVKPKGANAWLAGLQEDELGCVVVPVAFAVGPSNPPPWAVVRIGLLDESALRVATELGGALHQALWRSIVVLLAVAVGGLRR